MRATASWSPSRGCLLMATSRNPGGEQENLAKPRTSATIPGYREARERQRAGEMWQGTRKPPRREPAVRPERETRDYMKLVARTPRVQQIRDPRTGGRRRRTWQYVEDGRREKVANLLCYRRPQ